MTFIKLFLIVFITLKYHNKLNLHINNYKKIKMKKITILLFLFVISFSQAQLFSSVRTNGGPDTNTASRTVTDWLHYDSGTNYTSFGATSGSHTLGAYIKLTASLLTPHVNRQIEEVKFYLGQDATNITGNVTVEIYTDPSAAPVYTEDFAMSGLTAGDWNTVTLANPFVIDGSELYIGYKFTSAGYIIGVDDGANYVTNVNFYTYDGGPMTSWDSVAQYNFNLQAGIGGASATNDAGVSDVNLPTILPQPGNTDIEATITNYGVTTLTSIEFNYQVDGGTVQTDQLTGLNLTTGQSTTVTHSVPWNATAGTHTVDVYISNFNGNGQDDVAADDHKVKTVMVLNEVYPKNVVYEEGTGTWCGWCVRGIVGLKNMAHYHGDHFIGIAVHNGDPMVVTEYDTNLGIHSFPGGHINRKSNDVDPDYSSLETAYLAELNELPVAKIEITNKTWDAATRELTVEVTSTFALDIPSANYNASLIIVENGVTGTSNGYAQHNYYSGAYDLTDWEGTNYRNLPDPIPATDMVYDHVGRALVGGFDGVAGSIPAAVTYNTPYTYTFTHTLPASQNENGIDLVAIILDNNTGEIINGTEAKLTTVGVDELFEDYQVRIYPNPSTGIFNIAGAKDMDVAIFDMLGHQIIAKRLTEENTQLSLDNLAKGLYFAKFQKDGKTGVKKLIIK